jgi:hypothetical protein
MRRQPDGTLRRPLDAPLVDTLQPKHRGIDTSRERLVALIACIEREEVAKEDPPSTMDDDPIARTIVRIADVEPGPGRSRIAPLRLFHLADEVAQQERVHRSARPRNDPTTTETTTM